MDMQEPNVGTTWKKAKKRKENCGRWRKAVMLINASCVARSYHRKGAKELSFLGEDCYTLQQ
jgi:hypothetical protein